MALANLMADGVVRLKKGLIERYGGNSPVYEAIPNVPSKLLPIDAKKLESLHKFAKNNPLYDHTTNMQICNIDCTIYEGDINSYWLDSKKHDASCAPFYPTWVLSAYVLAVRASELGVQCTLDIGSGDGRIAYCCQTAGIKSHAIEIDENLSALQRHITDSTGVKFDIINADAMRLEYSEIDLTRPILFIGGLPQVGEILASGVIEKVLPIADSATFVLTGANPRYGSGDNTYGWDHTIHRFGLGVNSILTLPTKWTMEQPADTPYVFTTHQ